MAVERLGNIIVSKTKEGEEDTEMAHSEGTST
jgi:hypothetical protein